MFKACEIYFYRNPALNRNSIWDLPGVSVGVHDAICGLNRLLRLSESRCIYSEIDYTQMNSFNIISHLNWIIQNSSVNHWSELAALAVAGPNNIALPTFQFAIPESIWKYIHSTLRCVPLGVDASQKYSNFISLYLFLYDYVGSLQCGITFVCVWLLMWKPSNKRCSKRAQWNQRNQW